MIARKIGKVKRAKQNAKGKVKLPLSFRFFNAFSMAVLQFCMFELHWTIEWSSSMSLHEENKHKLRRAHSKLFRCLFHCLSSVSLFVRPMNWVPWWNHSHAVSVPKQRNHWKIINIFIYHFASLTYSILINSLKLSFIFRSSAVIFVVVVVYCQHTHYVAYLGWRIFLLLFTFVSFFHLVCCTFSSEDGFPFGIELFLDERPNALERIKKKMKKKNQEHLIHAPNIIIELRTILLSRW